MDSTQKLPVDPFLIPADVLGEDSQSRFFSNAVTLTMPEMPDVEEIWEVDA